MNLAIANFTSNPNNRSYQPRAFANNYEVPERIYQYTASVQQDLGGKMALTAAYVGAQGRNLFLRSVANQITSVVTNANPANAALVIRQFSIVQRDANGNVTGVQNPSPRLITRRAAAPTTTTRSSSGCRGGRPTVWR